MIIVYSDAYIHVKRTLKIQNTAAAGTTANNAKKVTFKNWSQFTNCTNEINITQVDDVHDTDVVIAMYNLIYYGYIYSKTSRSLWQYYRDELALNTAGDITDVPANNSISFKCKEKITLQTENDDTKDV